MTEEPALLKAIFAEPGEDTPRLVYADWLTENAADTPTRTAGQMLEKAEFIRLQILLASGKAINPVTGESVDLAANPELKAKMQAREEELLPTMIDLLNLGPDILSIIGREPNRISFERGFIHNLDLHGTPIRELPEVLYIRGDLSLYGTPITRLPEGLHVGGDLNLNGTPITRLPEGLHVGGDLYLSFTLITRLPEGLHVGGDLDLWETPITQLPEGLHVGCSLYLQGTHLTPKSARHILDMPGLSDKAKISGLRSAEFQNLAEQAERNATGRHEGRR